VQGKNGEQVNSATADIKVYLDGDDTPEGMVPLLTARSSTKRTSGFTSSVRPLQPAVCGLASIYEPSSSGSDTPDMESTMRYLKPSRSQQTRDKVNEIFGRL
jgi:hypothetical protein